MVGLSCGQCPSVSWIPWCRVKKSTSWRRWGTSRKGRDSVGSLTTQPSIIQQQPWEQKRAKLALSMRIITSFPCLIYLRLVIRTGEGNGTPLQYSCLENPMDRGAWWAAVHGVAKSQTCLSDFPFTFHFHALEKEMATHSSALAWRIPGTGQPDGLPSMGSHRVGHNWSDLAAGSVKAMVFPVVMYGCESWAIKKAESWRIDAFELWCWRREDCWESLGL